MYSTISADIITSTSIPREDWIEFIDKIKSLLSDLESRYSGFWGRIVKGDSIECVLDHPEDAFEAALLIKTYIKAFCPQNIHIIGKTSKFGVRIAIGIGEMKTIDRNLDIMDGDAIYRSGRALGEWTGWSKYAFLVRMENYRIQQICQLLMSFINHNINAATQRQCETLYYQLLVRNEKKVSSIMGIKFQGIYRNLGTIGWTHIENALQYLKTIDYYL